MNLTANNFTTLRYNNINVRVSYYSLGLVSLLYLQYHNDVLYISYIGSNEKLSENSMLNLAYALIVKYIN